VENKIKDLEARITILEKEINRLINASKTQKKAKKVIKKPLSFNLEQTASQALYDSFFDLFLNAGNAEFETIYNKTSLTELKKMNAEKGLDKGQSASRGQIKKNLLSQINQDRQIFGR
jgi:hypothetical protein